MSGEPTSTLRPVNSGAVNTLASAMGEAFVKAVNGIGHENLFRSCYRCINWTEGHGCKIYQLLPPVRIIVVGCDRFCDDEEIPF